jgi:hypothetical protein
MLKILQKTFFLALLFSCKTQSKINNNYSEDKELGKIINKLNKYPTNKKALEALPKAYENANQIKLIQIESAKKKYSTNYYDLKASYTRLQQIYELITKCPVALSLINPKNYQNELDSINNLLTISEYKNKEKILLDKIKENENNTKLTTWEDQLDLYQKLDSEAEYFNLKHSKQTNYSATNYKPIIEKIKEKGAAAWYNEGIFYFQNNNRQNLKYAYNCFNNVEKFIPNYLDCNNKRAAILNNVQLSISLLPMKDVSFYFTTGYNIATLFNYGVDFRETITSELNNLDKSNYIGNFYKSEDANQQATASDWEILFTLNEINIPNGPSTTNQIEKKSNKVKTSTDSIGNSIYTEVYADYITTRIFLDASASITISIIDKKNGRKILEEKKYSRYNWKVENHSYSGDYRALSFWESNDVNNTKFTSYPNKDEILSSLCRDLYNKMKITLQAAVKW